MKIKSIYTKAFRKYGKVLSGYDTKELLQTLDSNTKMPSDAVIYEPTLPALEKLPIAKEFSEKAFGGMPIELGYCNGSNTKLNCLEYHRGSELNIASQDIILLLARVQDIEHNRLSTGKVEAFRVPAGAVVEIYETTLHYAPCNNVLGKGEVAEGFRVVIVLPKDTNTEKPNIKPENEEDKLLWAKNKWLIAHPDTSEAKQGAVAGLIGPNIDIGNL